MTSAVKAAKALYEGMGCSCEGGRGTMASVGSLMGGASRGSRTASVVASTEAGCCCEGRDAMSASGRSIGAATRPERTVPAIAASVESGLLVVGGRAGVSVDCAATIGGGRGGG